MSDKFINEGNLEEVVLDAQEELDSFRGYVSINWLWEQVKAKRLILQNRSYQREKVTSVEWQQKLMKTVLENKGRRVPEIHIRAVIRMETVENGKEKRVIDYELVDGQQRLWAIIKFLYGMYCLPKGIIVDGNDFGGTDQSKLRLNEDVWNDLLNHRIGCIVYVNYSEQELSDLFVDVLNNTSDMKEQEKRNARTGEYSNYVRNVSRPYLEDGTVAPEVLADKFLNEFKLFERTKSGPKGAQKQVLKHFSSKFTLNHRMEVDEWVSELFYMFKHGVRNGVAQLKHSSWVREIQQVGGDYTLAATWEKDKREFTNLLKLADALIRSKSAQKQKKYLHSMVTLMMVLHAASKIKSGKLDHEKYVTQFFKTYHFWNDEDTVREKTTPGCDGLEKGWRTDNGGMLREFGKLFGGKGGNAIKTIFNILDFEYDKDPESWGIIVFDSRKSFPDRDVHSRWSKVGEIDEYTKLRVELEDVVGDHYIPRSYGIKMGGITEPQNLRVCHINTNKFKGNQSGPDFEKNFPPQKLIERLEVVEEITTKV